MFSVKIWLFCALLTRIVSSQNIAEYPGSDNIIAKIVTDNSSLSTTSTLNDSSNENVTFSYVEIPNDTTHAIVESDSKEKSILRVPSSTNISQPNEVYVEGLPNTNITSVTFKKVPDVTTSNKLSLNESDLVSETSTHFSTLASPANDIKSSTELSDVSKPFEIVSISNQTSATEENNTGTTDAETETTTPYVAMEDSMKTEAYTEKVIGEDPTSTTVVPTVLTIVNQETTSTTSEKHPEISFHDLVPTVEDELSSQTVSTVVSSYPIDTETLNTPRQGRGMKIKDSLIETDDQNTRGVDEVITTSATSNGSILQETTEILPELFPEVKNLTTKYALQFKGECASSSLTEECQNIFIDDSISTDRSGCNRTIRIKLILDPLSEEQIKDSFKGLPGKLMLEDAEGNILRLEQIYKVTTESKNKKNDNNTNKNPVMTYWGILSFNEFVCYIVIGSCFGCIVLFAFCLLCTKCFCRNKKITPGRNSPQLSLKLEDYKLTRIPRPTTLYAHDTAKSNSDETINTIVRPNNLYREDGTEINQEDTMSTLSAMAGSSVRMSSNYDMAVIPLEDYEAYSTNYNKMVNRNQPTDMGTFKSKRVSKSVDGRSPVVGNHTQDKLTDSQARSKPSYYENPNYHM